jgi:hypothetical protein
MPKAEEKKLQTEARKKFPRNKERQGRYVYGTLRNQGWRPKQPKRSEVTV